MLLPECFDLSLPAGWSSHTATLREKDFSYDPTLNSADKEKDHDIYGYFQSEKYFEDYRDEIKKEFTFKDEIKENAYAMKSAFGLRKRYQFTFVVATMFHFNTHILYRRHRTTKRLLSSL